MSVHVSGVSGSSSHLYRADAEKVRVDAICAGVTGRMRAMSGVTASAMLTDPTPLNVPKAAAETALKADIFEDATFVLNAAAEAVAASVMDEDTEIRLCAVADVPDAMDADADASLTLSTVG